MDDRYHDLIIPVSHMCQAINVTNRKRCSKMIAPLSSYCRQHRNIKGEATMSYARTGNVYRPGKPTAYSEKEMTKEQIQKFFASRPGPDKEIIPEYKSKPLQPAPNRGIEYKF